MLRLVHIALVCLLGFVLTGLPRLVAADECDSPCCEKHLAGDEQRCTDFQAANPCGAECLACLCTRAPSSAVPVVLEVPAVARLLLRGGIEGSGAPRDGAPHEVFQPPREA